MKNTDKLTILENLQEQIRHQVLSSKLVLNRNDEITLLEKLKAEDHRFKPIQFSLFDSFLSAEGSLFSKLAVIYKGRQLIRLVPNFVQVTPYDIAVSLTIYKKAYFSCLSALYLNQLTVLNPTDIYLNFEQSEKPKDQQNTILTQQKVDYGFRRPARITNNIATFTFENVHYQLYFLNSKHANYLGIEKIPINNLGQAGYAANIERNLIEVMIHPEYAGGVGNVLEAFSTAQPFLSVPKILDYLDKLAYTYPYEQSLLFYMSRADYTDKQLSEVKIAIQERHLGKINFYLQHQTINPILDEQSKVYYPREVQENN